MHKEKENNNVTMEKPDKHYLNQVSKIIINSVKTADCMCALDTV